MNINIVFLELVLVVAGIAAAFAGVWSIFGACLMSAALVFLATAPRKPPYN